MPSFQPYLYNFSFSVGSCHHFDPTILFLLFNGVAPSIRTILYNLYFLVGSWYHSDPTHIILFLSLWPLLAIKSNTPVYEHVPASFSVTCLISTHLLIPTWSIYFILDFEHFVAQGEFSSLVCRLCESLYGMKQSLQVWFGKFNTVILSLCVYSALCIKFSISWEDQAYWNLLSILWSRVINLQISHQAPHRSSY